MKGPCDRARARRCGRLREHTRPCVLGTEGPDARGLRRTSARRRGRRLHGRAAMRARNPLPPTPERCAPARPSAPRARGHACSEPTSPRRPSAARRRGRRLHGRAAMRARNPGPRLTSAAAGKRAPARPSAHERAAMRARNPSPRLTSAAAGKRTPARPSAHERCRVCSEPTVHFVDARPDARGQRQARGHACSAPRPPTHERCGGETSCARRSGHHLRERTRPPARGPTDVECDRDTVADASGRALGLRARVCSTCRAPCCPLSSPWSS